MTTTELHEGLVALVDGEPRLVAGYSPTSKRFHFPRADVCPYSGAADVESRHLSPTGTLWTWTAVTAAPPSYSGPVPYGFGVVELPEGIRVVTRITESNPDALRAGQPMVLVLDTVATEDGERSIYAFAPA